MENKAYLGDGVYVEFNGYQIVLTTSNGISITNSIYLEPDVYESLVLYVERLKEEAKRRREEAK